MVNEVYSLEGKDEEDRLKVSNEIGNSLARHLDKDDAYDENDNYEITVDGRKVLVNLDSKIPFLLYIPENTTGIQTIAMETNNLEDPNSPALFMQGLGTVKDLASTLDYKCPVLVPILPSTGVNDDDPYWQQLSLSSVTGGNSLDKDVIDAYDQARSILKNNYNIDTTDKMFLNGYSSTAAFAQRFYFGHYDMVDTMCLGGCLGDQPVDDDNIGYPLGTKDYKEIFGHDFDKEAFQQGHIHIYNGEHEEVMPSCDYTSVFGDFVPARRSFDGSISPMHNMFTMERSIPRREAEKYLEKFPGNGFDRQNALYEYPLYADMDCQFDMIDHGCHNYNDRKYILDQHIDDEVITCHGKGMSIIKSEYMRMKERQGEERQKARLTELHSELGDCVSEEIVSDLENSDDFLIFSHT